MNTDKAPGAGRNEYVTNPQQYQELANTQNWRQILSNFWVAPFEYAGNWWNSVEHMFQSYKINLADPQQAYLFTLNSGSQLGKAPGNLAQKNRKIVQLTPTQLQQWDQLRPTVIYNAMLSKFMQNPELATGNAELWHGAPRVKAARQVELERIRQELRNADFTPLYFEEALQKLLNAEIVDTKVVPKISGNALVYLYDTNGRTYLVKARYDSATNQMFPPG